MANARGFGECRNLNFRTATVVKKIGRGYLGANIGDFNNNYNNDFNNN